MKVNGTRIKGMDEGTVGAYQYARCGEGTVGAYQWDGEQPIGPYIWYDQCGNKLPEVQYQVYEKKKGMVLSGQAKKIMNEYY
jgi:hypothetical protein